jgi:hypothetical protein
MLVVLKIPVAYLCVVVWWAIKAEPRPPEGAGRLAPLAPDPGDSGFECEWRTRRARLLRRGPTPRGGGRGRPARVAYARRVAA